MSVKRITYIVVDTKGVKAGEQCPILGRFKTENEASVFIGTLPEYETGRYGIDTWEGYYERTRGGGARVNEHPLAKKLYARFKAGSASMSKAEAYDIGNELDRLQARIFELEVQAAKPILGLRSADDVPQVTHNESRDCPTCGRRRA
jgi:hypothetical protein